LLVTVMCSEKANDNKLVMGWGELLRVLMEIGCVNLISFLFVS